MKIETLNIADIRASSFNPRITLEKGSREYEAIAASIREFGFVEPLVVNSHNMCCLGGHQRLSVLKDMGVESVECVMVEEPDQAREKALCVALNRIKGEWDMDMLAALLQDEAVFSLPTGFEEGEVDLERMLEDVEPPELSEEEPEEAEEPAGPTVRRKAAGKGGELWEVMGMSITCHRMGSGNLTAKWRGALQICWSGASRTTGA